MMKLLFSILLLLSTSDAHCQSQDIYVDINNQRLNLGPRPQNFDVPEIFYAKEYNALNLLSELCQCCENKGYDFQLIFPDNSKIALHEWLYKLYYTITLKLNNRLY